MNKNLKQYAKQRSMTVDEKAGIVYGRIHDYFVVIQQAPATVQLWAKQGSASPYLSVTEFLNRCQGKFNDLLTASYSENIITAQFKGKGTEYISCLDGFLQEITDYCTANQFIPCCESCQGEQNLSLYQVETSHHLLCSSCYDNPSVRVRLLMNTKASNKNGNVFAGIIGALLGAILGSLVWIMIYQAGRISALGGIAIIFCSLKGYELLNGQLSKLGIVLSCIISALVLLGAEYLCIGIAIYKNNNVTFGDALSLISLFLRETELRSAVATDLFAGYLLMTVGAWGTIRRSFASTNVISDTRKIASVTDHQSGNQ